MKIFINGEYDGRTLLSYLRGELSLSRRLLTRLKLREDGITVNGKRVTVRYILRVGDVLELADGDECSSEAVVPFDIPVDILYEDRDALAVAKPHGMPTHPSHGHTDDTLANALAYKYRDIPFVFRPINRLDRDTSGVVLVAKNQRAASFFADSMKNGEFKKTYLAVTDGEVPPNGTVEKPIRRANASIIIRETCEESDSCAQHARTEFVRIDIKNGHSFVLVTPKTGRTHQIRVHLASIGAPIFGDSLYGKESEYIGRQALHAYELEFPSLGGGRITVRAPLPQDMTELCEKLEIGEKYINEISESKK